MYVKRFIFVVKNVAPLTLVFGMSRNFFVIAEAVEAWRTYCCELFAVYLLFSCFVFGTHTKAFKA